MTLTKMMTVLEITVITQVNTELQHIVRGIKYQNIKFQKDQTIIITIKQLEEIFKRNKDFLEVHNILSANTKRT